MCGYEGQGESVIWQGENEKVVGRFGRELGR